MGARGSGKTALLMHLSNEAQSRGWTSVNVTAIPGMLEDIYERALSSAKEFISPNTGKRITGVAVGQMLSLDWENTQPETQNWRTRMSTLLDELSQHDVGLLITVDEVQADLDEMIQLAAVYQHFVGENRKVALLMAGLPGKISALLRNDSVSFLRRACLHKLGRIADAEIGDAFVKTIEEGGRTIETSAVSASLDAIEGFPYMMQLVGYRIWNAHSSNGTLTIEDATTGIELARRDFTERVLDATYYDLSAGDLRFLKGMLEDQAESRVADIARRIGVSSNYASTYKRRLIEQGIIGERGRSMVAFEIPGFREYLIEKTKDGDC